MKFKCITSSMQSLRYAGSTLLTNSGSLNVKQSKKKCKKWSIRKIKVKRYNKKLYLKKKNQNND